MLFKISSTVIAVATLALACAPDAPSRDAPSPAALSRPATDAGPSTEPRPEDAPPPAAIAPPPPAEVPSPDAHSRDEPPPAAGALSASESLGKRGTGMGGGGLGRAGTSGKGTITPKGLLFSHGSGMRGSEFGSASGVGGVRAGAPARPAPVTAPLRAGATDDNEDFAAYRKFLGAWSDRSSTPEGYRSPDVEGRTLVRVVDRAGRALPGAHVRVTAGERTLETETYGDGVAALYVGRATGDLAAEASLHDRTQRVTFVAGTDPTITLDLEEPEPAKVPLDVTFLVDTTASMGDEIDRIKRTLTSITRRIHALERPVHLRYSAIFYRDHADEYLTRSIRFTRDVQAFNGELAKITADGGGDYPEALSAGLAAAVAQPDWRRGVAKVVFLIADAPPHFDRGDEPSYLASTALARKHGIRVHAVAASGLDPLGSLVFRQIAQGTRGKFIFIEYGGDIAASAAKHGVSGHVQSNNLDDILYREIEREIAQFGRGTSPKPGAVSALETGSSR